MDRATKLRRCAALKNRVNNGEVARVAEESRRRSEEVTDCRQRVVKRAREEPAFRSLSVQDDEGVEDALQAEAAVVYRSVNNTTVLPDAPLPVSDIDRNMEAAFKVLLKAPSTKEEAARHWDIAMTFDATVTDLRNKMDQPILEKLDATFKTAVSAQGAKPVAWQIAKGFDQSAKYMIAEAAKAERELLAAACGEFVDREQALVAAAQASEVDQPHKLCHNDSCVVCFEAMPTDNPLAPNSGWTILACKHGFCTDCLSLWQQSGGCACPICRKPIPAAASTVLHQSAPNVYRSPAPNNHHSLGADEEDLLEMGLGYRVDEEGVISVGDGYRSLGAAQYHLGGPFYRTAVLDEDSGVVYRTAVN